MNYFVILVLDISNKQTKIVLNININKTHAKNLDLINEAKV